MNHQTPGSPVDWGPDGAVFKLESRIVDGRLVCLDRGPEDFGIDDELVVVFFGHIVLLGEIGIAFDFVVCVLQLSPVPGQIGFGLFEPYLKRPGVDLEKQITSLDVLSFFEIDADHLSADLGFDLNGGVGFDIPDRPYLQGDVRRGDIGHTDGDGRASSGTRLSAVPWRSIL